MDRVILNKIYTALLSAAVTFLAGFALKKVWKLTTGAEPPDPEDPAVPVRQAVTWFITSGIGVGVAQLLFHRTMAKRLQLAPVRKPAELS
ncbi:MAG: DUF4235 domain-containing protein [Propionibacteriaceae bacterium]|jgi:lysylphosphatidylglycerol synthetase-like protein (DUF2156 family)|nr:DUF4235 domain-containing protein [Propionibacteriaceae bacterium]